MAKDKKWQKLVIDPEAELNLIPPIKSGVLLYGKPGSGKSHFNYGNSFGPISHFMHSNRWLNGIKKDQESIRKYCEKMSNTKLKKMLYSLINRRDRLEKKGNLPKFDPTGWFTGSGASLNNEFAPTSDELEVVHKSIRIISDEIAHRKFAQLFPDSDTIDDRNEEE